MILWLDLIGGVCGFGFGEFLSLVGFFWIGLGDGDFDLFDWDLEFEDMLEVCMLFFFLLFLLCIVFIFLIGLLLFVEFDLLFFEDWELDWECDFDCELECECDCDLEGVGEFEWDCEWEVECDVECDFDFECECEECDEFEEEDEDLFCELWEEIEWCLGDVVFC